MVALGSLFRRQPAPLLGLDVSSSSVKLVELAQDAGGKLVLERCAIEPLERGWITDGNVEKFDEVAEAVRRVVRKSGTRTRNAALALSAIAALSGPSFAADLARGLPTAVVIAASAEERAAELAQAFSTERFRCYSTGDLVGVDIVRFPQQLEIDARRAEREDGAAHEMTALAALDCGLCQRRDLLELLGIGLVDEAERQLRAAALPLGEIVDLALEQFGVGHYHLLAR